MSSKKSQVLVAGNATIDALVEGKVVRVSDDHVRVVRRGKVRDFYVVDGPIVEGYKHRTDIRDMEAHIRGLKVELGGGGGGFNTITSMIDRAEHNSEVSGFYMDISDGDPLITEQLDRRSIKYDFFSHRPVPTNAILGIDRDDKIILKGRTLDRKDVTAKDIESIDSAVSSSNLVSLNGVKDVSFAEALINSSTKHGKLLFFNVTPSLESDFVLKRVLSSGVVQISYEDIAKLFGENPLKYSKDQLFSMAVDYMRKIRTDGLNDGQTLVVTAGSRGAFVMTPRSGIRHLSLKPDTADQVAYDASTKEGSTNGAGDVFHGSLVIQHLWRRRVDPIDLVTRASKAAVRYIGYQGELRANSFNIKKYR